MRINKIVAILALLAFVASPVHAINNGDQAPNFTLKSASGEEVSLDDFKGKPVILEWYNSKCPFVANHYNSSNMQKLQEKAAENEMVWLTINSTNREHKDFRTLDQLKEEIAELGIKASAVLADPEGSVGKDFQAKTTPHIFVLNEEQKVIYQGAVDNQPSFDADPSAATNYVESAIADLAAGNPIRTPKTDPYGCSVKY